MTKPRNVRPLPPAQLDRLNGRRLLAYKKRLLSLRESPEATGWSATRLKSLDPQLIWFKSDPRWQDLYQTVLDRLDSFGHVDR